MIPNHCDSSIPLPRFVRDFLDRKLFTRTDLPSRMTPIESSCDISRSIESLISAQSEIQVHIAYQKFWKFVRSSPLLFGHDHRQFLFPFFVHLALLLFKNRQTEIALQFIRNWRGYQPPEVQKMIKQMESERERFQPPPFEVHVTQYAFDDLMREIEQEKLVLLGNIITRYIDIRICHWNHELLYVKPGNAIVSKSASILQKVEPHIEPLSVTFHPDDLERVPSVMQDDNGHILLTQALPDVAHFEMYNHRDTIRDMRVSKCTRLLSMAYESNVQIHRLDTDAQTTSKTIMSHLGEAWCAAVSPDSRYVVSGGTDCQLRLGQIEIFRPLSHYSMHLKPISSVAWDSRSEFFLGSSQDRTISMWNLRSPDCLRFFHGHQLAVYRAIFSRDDRSIISCSSDLFVKVWDVGEGRLRARMACGRSVPNALAVSATNDLITCGMRDGSIISWDASSGKQLWHLQPFDSPVSSINFTNDGTLLLGSSLSGDLWAWRLTAEEPVVVMKTATVASTIDSITVSDRNLVCTTGRSTRV